MQFPIVIELHRSRILNTVIFLFVLISSVALFALPAPSHIQIALLLIDCLFATLAWQQLSPRICCLRLERGGQIFVLRNANDAFDSARILHGVVVHPWLTVFRLKTGDGRIYSLIVTVDSLNASDFRCLRIFLRWKAEFSLLCDDA